jgi:hypothetical protein
LVSLSPGISADEEESHPVGLSRPSSPYGKGSPLDPETSPYAHFAIQPLDFVMQNALSPAQAKVIQYVCRYPFRGGVQDLHKARHVLDWLIEWEQRQPRRPR